MKKRIGRPAVPSRAARSRHARSGRNSCVPLPTAVCTPGKGRVENTAPAFLAAIARGYGIECDLQAAEDGTPMVFHDDKLDRLLGVPVASPAAPASLTGCATGQDTRILTFAELPATWSAAAPRCWWRSRSNAATPLAAFLDRIARQARAYKGPIALMSFDRDGRLGARQARPDNPARASDRQPSAPGALVGRTGRPRDAATIARVLGRAPAGSAFLPSTCSMLRGARELDDAHAHRPAALQLDHPSRRERATAARFADAPIFEGYEP